MDQRTKIHSIRKSEDTRTFTEADAFDLSKRRIRNNALLAQQWKRDVKSDLYTHRCGNTITGDLFYELQGMCPAIQCETAQGTQDAIASLRAEIARLEQENTRLRTLKDQSNQEVRRLEQRIAQDHLRLGYDGNCAFQLGERIQKTTEAFETSKYQPRRGVRIPLYSRNGNLFDLAITRQNSTFQLSTSANLLEDTIILASRLLGAVSNPAVSRYREVAWIDGKSWFITIQDTRSLKASIKKRGGVVPMQEATKRKFFRDIGPPPQRSAR